MNTSIEIEDKEKHRILISSIVSLCDRATIDISNGIDRAIRTIIGISLKFLDRRMLVENIVPGGYVDWEYVDNSENILAHKKNLLGDSDIWLELLRYIDFSKATMEALLLRTTHPPIWTLYKTMEENVGHIGTRWTFNDTCKLFLLSNVRGIPFNYVTERYITKSLTQNSLMICSKIMEEMADARHDSSVYLSSVQHILEKSIINTTAIEKHIQHYQGTVQAQQASWKMKHMSIQCRPSMRTVLATKRMNRVSTCDSLQETTPTAVTFNTFCDIVRFPNCMSHLLRNRCYLLACQPETQHFKLADHIGLFVPEDLARIINDHAIIDPDEKSLRDSINTLTLNIHPFPELKQFRQQCFAAYPVTQSERLTMTDILKLYVSAYQYPSLWKQLWKAVDPLMSTQISKAVESFVAKNKFATQNFIQILKTSSPFQSVTYMT
jgi:hypothetical protein